MSSFLQSRELRKEYKKVRNYVKIGPIFLTRYEKARIVGARALQISERTLYRKIKEYGL